MGQRIGGLDRTLDFVTGGVLDGKESRQHQLAFSSFHEADQQFRLPISGGAAEAWSRTDHAVNFLYPFLWAPTRREVPFSTPHFTYGSEIEEPEKGTLGAFVVIHASVVRWEVGEELWVTGATVRIGAYAPEGEATYKALVHLNFQGLVAETEAPGE